MTIIIAALQARVIDDTMDGGADADVLQLSAGEHAFSDNDKLKNIETIKAHGKFGIGGRSFCTDGSTDD